MKYFIEDIETHEWYCLPIGVPTVHIYGKGWDNPDPLNKDYWTTDPNKAFSFFKDKDDAEKYLTEMKLRDSFTLYKNEIGREKRNLIITEHEFI